MNKMTSNEIRDKYLNFFKNRAHQIIPSASLIPKNDPSVLFNTAGMQPLVPYLLGEKHPMGERIADVQKCVRTGDIEDVGDNRHLTFFEMLGNWSLGDYFKEESIKWSFDFLTNKEEGLGLDKERLYVTVFEGDKNAPRDDEAASIWKKYIPENRIYYLPAKNNWWSAGDNGPCGPDTEIFYDINEEALGDLSHEEFVDADEKGKVLEVWNNVFMQYEKKDGLVVGKLSKHNVDTGMGLERITMVKQKVRTVFETDLFKEILETITNNSTLKDERIYRIIADHTRTAVFMIGDGVLPSNTGRGYVLRRILRRVVRFKDSIGLSLGLENLIDIIIKKYSLFYNELLENSLLIKEEIQKEENKFRQTLEKGLKEFEKGTDPFILFSTYGFPIELTEEIAKEKSIKIDRVDFEEKLKKHQELSRESTTAMFKGGLANNSEKTTNLHTAHHLLLAGLQSLISKDIKQKGSNITEERLRLDFNFERKLTDEEKKNIEDWVNEKIKKELHVVKKEMPLSQAIEIGAQMEFGTKYPETVSVYFIEDKEGNVYSKEFCGGPHASNTKDLGVFKILKEEAVASGIRRIKAILE